jgi:hypothetical protein
MSTAPQATPVLAPPLLDVYGAAHIIGARADMHDPVDPAVIHNYQYTEPGKESK